MNELDNFKKIEKYDESSMLEIIESFPEQCHDADSIGNDFELPKEFKKPYKNIVFAGVGGSAIGADLVRSYVSEDSGIPISVNRNYDLPNFVNEDTLVIVSSYSGNTEETLSAYNEAVSRGSDIMAITSGGKLEKLAKDSDIPCLIIPEGFPPRCALGYSFFPLLIVLSKIGVVRGQEAFIDDAIRNLRYLRDNKIGYKVPRKNNMAKKVAIEIFGKIPLVYGNSDGMDAVVTRWKGQFAENSKTISFGNLFPEMNHNEIAGWEKPKKLLKEFVPIFLRDASDHPRISKRMDITKNLFTKEGIKSLEVVSSGKELLSRIFSLIYIGDFVSLYLAVLNGIDPTPVEKISYLKKELAKVPFTI